MTITQEHYRQTGGPMKYIIDAQPSIYIKAEKN